MNIPALSLYRRTRLILAISLFAYGQTNYAQQTTNSLNAPVLAPSTSFSPLANSSGFQGGHSDVNVNACLNSDVESKLRKKEIALLGEQHANQHATARNKQCKVALGIERVPTADPIILAAAAKQAPSSIGQWSAPFNIPVAGITSVLLNTGHVLFWSYEPTQWYNPNSSNTGVAYLWDPVTRTGRSITPPENIWCAGQTILSDGRVYIAGGNLRYPDPSAVSGEDSWQGALSHYTFNPYDLSWTRQFPDMSVGRWYPTTTQLNDNRVMITSGFDQSGSEAITPVVEIFTPSAGLNGNGSISTVSFHNPSGLYPFQFLLPSGKVLQAGPDQTNTALFTSNTWGWTNIPNMRLSHYLQANGLIYTDASATQVKQKVLIAGGVSGETVLREIEILDSVNPEMGWQSFPSWQDVRHNANTIILPDGRLFTAGGNSTNTTYDNPVFSSEIYNKPITDSTGSWVKVAPHSIPAAYHSSAILLPDGTVLLSQDDQDKSASQTHQVQIYSPPYLFKGNRPQIMSIPTSATWNQRISVETDTNKIGSVMLISPGAVTHANDMHQRAIKLPFQAKGRILDISIPSGANLTPPGYYMLFVINSNGVPSVGKFIRVFG